MKIDGICFPPLTPYIILKGGNAKKLLVGLCCPTVVLCCPRSWTRLEFYKALLFRAGAGACYKALLFRARAGAGAGAALRVARRGEGDGGSGKSQNCFSEE